MKTMKLILPLVAGLTWLNAPSLASAADAFPARTVKITSPFSTTSAPTLLVRMLGDKLSAIWPQRVIIEPKPGASGFNAIRAVRGAAPDGHELLLMSEAHWAVNPAIYGSKLPYNMEKDFVPVATVNSAPFYVTVSATGPYQTIPALINAAKSGPDKVSYGISAVGNPTHLGAAMFEYQTGTKMLAVPFSDHSQLYLTVVKGDIDWALATLGSALSFVESKKIIMLGIGAKQRSSRMPDVPTVEEAGGPKGYEVVSRTALFVPRGTPPEIIKRLNADIAAQLAQPDILKAIMNFGLDPERQTPEQISELIRADVAKYGELVPRIGLKAE